MKYLNLLALAALAAAPLMGHADSLTPEEAYSLFTSQQAKAPAFTVNSPKLAYTSLQSQVPGVYIFSAEEGNGFVVLAADDAVGNILLGFSDESTFDADNIPAPMQIWLDCQTRAVLYTAENGIVNAYDGSRAPSRAEKENIPAICKTKWDQDSPYNNLCPTLGGRRAVTGCVATAMAQIMKVHEWPVTGVGSHSYTYKYNGTTYTASADFGATTYDWANMKNTYVGSSTATSKTAVATLMYHCGVASNMEYDPDGSGASEFDAGTGMMDYFNYDKGLERLEPAWYTKPAWLDMVYEQLAAGQPLLYTGANANWEGHAFVCDGYQNGLFHINWGWGGLSDGFFDIDNLNPDSQGIGGGTTPGAFNYYNGVLTNIRKPVDGSTYRGRLALDGQFRTNRTTYTRNNSTNVTIKAFVYAAALKTVSYTVALKLKSESDVDYITLYTESLPPMYGWDQFPVPATYFPVGEYDVTLAYKYGSSDWQDVNYDLVNQTPGVHMNVTSSGITVSAMAKESLDFVSFDLGDTPFPGTSVNMPATLSMTPPTIKATVRIGSAAQQENVRLDFYDKSNKTLIYSTDYQTASVTANNSETTLTFVGPWPALQENTTYSISLYTENLGQIGKSYYVKILHNTTDGIMSISADDNAPAVYYNMQGQRVLDPIPGLYIVKQGDKVSKTIIK